MREILFRGKMKTDSGECKRGAWVYGDFVTLIDGKEAHPHIYGKGEIATSTIGQYTGLTDKNGTRIFEGDIVNEVDIKHKGETQIKGKVYEVKMRKGCWIVKNHKGKCDYEKWDFLNTFAQNVEVIGNIHDNPELLKSEAQSDGKVY